MIHFHDIKWDLDRPNECRADYGSRISACTPDWGENELETDITDALADVVHFIRRCGLEPRRIFEGALYSAQGDLEDGPEAKVDKTIAQRHEYWAGQQNVTTGTPAQAEVSQTGA